MQSERRPPAAASRKCVLAAKIEEPAFEFPSGEMAEWLKAHAWKACLGETLTWVRIPLSPPSSKPSSRPVVLRHPGTDRFTKQASTLHFVRQRHSFPRECISRLRTLDRALASGPIAPL